MRVFFKKFFLILSVFIIFQPVAFCVENESAFFDLMTIADSIINADSSNKSENLQVALSKDAADKYSQGNIVASYSAYSDILPLLNNDFAIFNLAKTLYRAGFFSLSHSALMKIKYKDNLRDQIADLELSYDPFFALSKQEEIYLAKATSAIYFDNSAEEIVFDLSKNSDLLKSSDYANYVMAQGQIQLKQYNQALDFIDIALQKKSDNVCYLYAKAKILMLNGNYKQAIKFIDNLSKRKMITNNYMLDFQILRLKNQQKLTKNSLDKKLIDVEISYISGDYYKAIQLCDEILSADKQNVKALNYMAKSQYNTQNLQRAREYSNLAYQIKPNDLLALENRGNIEFADYNYVNALNYYRRANFRNQKNVRLINKIILSGIFAKESEKQIERYANLSKNYNSNPTFEFLDIANSITKYVPVNKVNLSEEYLKKAIVLYPLNIDAWVNFAFIQVNNGNYSFAQNIVEAIYISNVLDYRYYYIKGLVQSATKDNSGALSSFKKATELNPAFLPAKELYNSLQYEL